MSIAANQQPSPADQERSDNIVKLLRVLFHEDFCPDNDIAPHQKVGVLPAYFCGWLDKHMNIRTGENECDKAGVPHETWGFVQNMLGSGIAVEQLVSVWYTIVLADRPKPLHPLKSIQTLVLLTWNDGTISPINAFATNEMLQTPDNCFTDDLVAQIINNNARALVQKTAESPLDALHDGASSIRFSASEPEDPYDVFMGIILKAIPQLKPTIREPVKNYMRLCQAIIRPVVPAAVLRQFQSRQAKPATGGWDDAPAG